jgi:hypothetical protein
MMVGAIPFGKACGAWVVVRELDGTTEDRRGRVDGRDDDDIASGGSPFRNTPSPEQRY